MSFESLDDYTTRDSIIKRERAEIPSVISSHLEHRENWELRE
jgi:hypothetical protein